jgi:type 1 glutamine amidotransferase
MYISLTMINAARYFVLSAILLCYFSAQAQKRPIRILAIYENGGHHVAYSKAAKIWLDSLAAAEGFTIDYINHAQVINEAYLKKYKLFIQLDYPPYGWGKTAEDAFIKYISEGRGGWIGFHHASLVGKFDGYPMWDWYYHFIGNIKFKNYIATFADATVRVEKNGHPIMKGVPATFTIKQDEWYTYDQSPRAHVSVLANVDEASYQPKSDITMGDHPVVWTNPNYKARNVYIFMGHSPGLFSNRAYTTLFKNAIFWAAK